KLAGSPGTVVGRARQVRASLAVHHGPAAPPATMPVPGGQFSLFTEYLPHPALEQLRELKLDGLAPMEAFDELRRLRELAERTATPTRPDSGRGAGGRHPHPGVRG